MAGTKDRKVKTVHLIDAVQVNLPGTATNSVSPGKDQDVSLEPGGVYVETLKGGCLIPWARVRAVYFD